MGPIFMLILMKNTPLNTFTDISITDSYHTEGIGLSKICDVHRQLWICRGHVPDSDF